MKNQDVLYFLFALVFHLTFISVQAQTKTIHISKWTGETTSIGIGLIDKITFSENDLVMKYKNGTSENLGMLTIRKCTFGNTSSVSNWLEKKETMSFYIDATNILVLKNLPEGTHSIRIYSVAGLLVQSGDVCSDAPSVDLQHLEKGIYIVKVNNKLLKFVRS